MYKQKKKIPIVYALIACIAVFLGFYGCGGNKGTSYKQFLGLWETGCESYQIDKSRIRSVGITEEFDINFESSFYSIFAYELFNTGNCSGDSSYLILGGTIRFGGEFVTSICKAEKIDVQFLIGEFNNIRIGGNELRQEIINVGLVNPLSNIICRNDNQLLLGLITPSLDGASSSTRPVEMNVTDTFNYRGEF